MVGCAGSFAGPDSPASCYLISASTGGWTWRILVDLGNGALGALQRHLDPAEIDAIFLTHLHPDHCSDVSGLYVMRKYRPGGALTEPLSVFGPRDTFAQMVAMYYDSDPAEISRQFAVTQVENAQEIKMGPLRITPYLMNHPVECFGYRITDGSATIALTGDTDTTPNLVPLLRGADLVLMDSAFIEGREEARGIHLTGRRAAEAAVQAGGVRRLMLTHIPAWNDAEECRAEAQSVWPAEVELARAGRTYDI